MPAIELKNIIKNFKTPTSDVEVLKNVNFSADAGSLSLVLGPSGSGKSTFLTIAGGIQTPTDGIVTTAGENLEQLLARHEMRCGWTKSALFCSLIIWCRI